MNTEKLDPAPTVQFIVRHMRANGAAEATEAYLPITGTEIQNFGQDLGDWAYATAFGPIEETSRGIPGGAQLIVIETQSETARSFTRTGGGAWVVAAVDYASFPPTPTDGGPDLQFDVGDALDLSKSKCLDGAGLPDSEDAMPLASAEMDDVHGLPDDETEHLDSRTPGSGDAQNLEAFDRDEPDTDAQMAEGDVGERQHQFEDGENRETSDD